MPRDVTMADVTARPPPPVAKATNVRWLRQCMGTLEEGGRLIGRTHCQVRGVPEPPLCLLGAPIVMLMSAQPMAWQLCPPGRCLLLYVSHFGTGGAGWW